MRDAKPKTIQVMREYVVEEKRCPQCGKQFEGIKTAKFCSSTCLKQADYAKHAETRRAKRREAYQEQRARVQPDALPEMLSLAQAAEALGISPSGISQAIKRGKLTVMQFGNVKLVPRAALVVYEQHKGTPGRKRKGN